MTPSLIHIPASRWNGNAIKKRGYRDIDIPHNLPISASFASPLSDSISIARRGLTVASSTEDVSSSSITPTGEITAPPEESAKVPAIPPPIAATYVAPPLTEEMKRELDLLQRRFARLELEPHGPKRGIATTLKIMAEEKLEERITTSLANIYLNNWIYRRYALRLGYPVLIQVPGEVVANTLIREGTTVRFWKYKNPKTVLKELFRYGESVMQQRYLKKDADSLKPKPPSLLTPEEEAYEKRAWDYSLYAPKPYGHKRKRPGKWRKLKKKRNKVKRGRPL
jgi:hypothetical protein